MASWAGLGVHLMNQPSLLPVPPHVVTPNEPTETDPYVAATELCRCSNCGLVQPVVTCECGRSLVVTLRIFGIDSDEVPTFIPTTLYYRCPTCRVGKESDGNPSIDAAPICIQCDKVLMMKKQRK